MNLGQRAKFEPLRSVAFGSISGTYTAIGTPIGDAAHAIFIDNLTDANMFISLDGINNHIVVAANSGRVIDISTNRIGPVENLQLPQNITFYVKQVTGAPSLGSIYVGVMYASIN